MTMYQQPQQPPPPAQQSAMEAMLSGRTELAETRLAVTATQIVERLRIRASHLSELLDEELAVDSKRLGLETSSAHGGSDFMGLSSQLDEKESQIRSAQRREDTECWRDLTHIMRDFLNAWEGFSRNEAKSRFLNALPQQDRPLHTVGKNPAPPNTLHNDHYTNYDRK